MIARFVMLILGILGLVLVLPAASGRSAVVWTFHEVSCAPDFGTASCALQPPSGLAQLVLPDINSSGTWSLFYNHDTNMVTQYGDMDFSLELAGGGFQAPGFHPGHQDTLSDVSYDIAFSSSLLGLSFSENYLGAFNAFCFKGNITAPGGCVVNAPGGDLLVASDDMLLGCQASQGTCRITGDWVLSVVAEPSTRAILLGILVLMITFAAGGRINRLCGLSRPEGVSRSPNGPR